MGWERHTAASLAFEPPAARPAYLRAAARTSPTADQGGLGDRWEKSRRWASERVDELKGFMAERAAAFRSVARALRVVGVALVAVGAVLAVLGFGGAVMAAGAVMWGAGDALDATVDWAEGETTGRELLVSAGLTLGLSVVGGGAAKVGAKALVRLAPRVGQFVESGSFRTGSPAAGAGGRLPQDLYPISQRLQERGGACQNAGASAHPRLAGRDARVSNKSRAEALRGCGEGE